MKERPICVGVIGYIIGILGGLYLKFSIVFLYIPIIATYYIIIKKYLKISTKNKFKLISLRRYYRYVKLIINSKAIFIFIIFSVISNTIIILKNNQYENSYQDDEKIQIVGIVISEKIEKQYYDLYKIKVNSKKLNMYIQISKKADKLEYGDKIKLQGQYKKPSKQRNYGGYNDEQYLKTLKICGRLKVEKIEIIGKNQKNIFSQLAHKVKIKIEEKIETYFKKENASILKGLILGETKQIEEEVKESFQTANISHILAVSGIHINYMILGSEILLKDLIGKRKTKIITIIILISYIFITGFSPSVVRAVVMGVLTIGGGIIYRKNDIWNSMGISLLIILIYNPFSILNIGLQLSYLGTIGILLFQPVVLEILNYNHKKSNKLKKLKEIIAVSLSSQIVILPIILYHFNILGIYFLFTNILVSIIIGSIIILGFFYIFSSFIFYPVAKIIHIFLNCGLEILNWIAKFSQLPMAKIYIPTPNINSIFIYFVLISILRKIYLIYHLNNLTPTQRRIKNLIELFRYKFNQNKNKYRKIIFSILIILTIIYILPKNLKIYFVDVGQGDCTFIVTPKNKTILIDGGGNLTKEFDVGKNTLIPYLLDRGYTTIDYIIISHFDQDHVRTGC